MTNRTWKLITIVIALPLMLAGFAVGWICRAFVAGFVAGQENLDQLGDECAKHMKKQRGGTGGPAQAADEKGEKI